MVHTVDGKKALIQTKEIDLLNNSPAIIAPDPQVNLRNKKAKRRTFSHAEKLRFLEAFEACENASARGEFLRKEGLYYVTISNWKKARDLGQLTSVRKNKSDNSTKLEQLLRENQQLKKKLSQANAVLELQKKVSELLGIHILPHENNELNS
jgi:transposase